MKTSVGREPAAFVAPSFPRAASSQPGSRRARVSPAHSQQQGHEQCELSFEAMKAFGSWALVAVLMAGITAPSFGQQKPLNATVVVREHPSSTVPTECEQGLAMAAPRAAQPVPEPAALPETSSMIANQDVAQALRRVQAFAEANDHDGFVEALAEARTAADAAPPGGQRDAARDALRVESDIDRLWTFAVTSPTGAFFDASSEDGALLTMLRQYPDYGRSIVDSTLVVGGQTLYPTRESRQFLIRQAASRLVRLGIHSAPRVPRAPAVARNQTAPDAPATVSPSTTATTPTPHQGSRSAASKSTAGPVTRAGHRPTNPPVARDGVKPSPPEPQGVSLRRARRRALTDIPARQEPKHRPERRAPPAKSVMQAGRTRSRRSWRRLPCPNQPWQQRLRRAHLLPFHLRSPQRTPRIRS